MKRQLSEILEYLDESQWWPKEMLELKQLVALRRLVRHARKHVPYYKSLFQGLGENFPDSLEQWRSLPLLTRFDVQKAASLLHSTEPPVGHHQSSKKFTSGSTGKPVVVLGSWMTSLIWRALTIRDHLWHERDFNKKLGVIRWMQDGGGEPPAGSRSRNWGAATGGIETGECAILSVSSTTAEQAAWLAAERPDYLLSYPSALENLIAFFKENDPQELPNLLEVRCFGEVLNSKCRRLCESVWKVKMVDVYSSEEVGYIALQCPDYNHYHVMSENLLVEVVDSQGKVCKPGQVGRVVVTSLHNYTSPLLRYDIGDYAEVGHPCMCGRRLPVLKRILGRARNMFTLPSGEKIWPSFQFQPGSGLELLPIRQFQIIQRSLEEVCVNLVTTRRLEPGEEELVRSAFLTSLRYPFAISIRYVDTVSRSPTGKFEDFCSIV